MAKSIIDGPKKARVPRAKTIAAKKVAERSKFYEEETELPEAIEALPFEKRPMIWRDLVLFKNLHNRTAADVVYDLVLQTSHAFAKKSPSRTVVPFDLELLVRLYNLYPSSCAWNRPDVRETFELLYGDVIRSFGKEHEDVVRLSLGRRYARLLGRVDTGQYRWLVSTDGKVTRRLSNILSKIKSIANSGQDARLVFEKVSLRVGKLRRMDINSMAPMPTIDNVIKPPGTRGRRLDSERPRKPSTQPAYTGGAFS